MTLVRKIAGGRSFTDSGVADYDDRIQDGVLGLIDAHSKFDKEKGSSFESYAKRRIAGAIIDGIRSTDWVPRRARARSDEDIVEVHSLEAHGDTALAFRDEAAERADYATACRTILNRLTAAERSVAVLTFLDGFTTTEAARMLGLSTGRVSQLRKSCREKCLTLRASGLL